MQDSKSQFTAPAFMFGMMVGAAIGVFAANPRTRKWVQNKSEWARTDGKEAIGRMKNHVKQGAEAVKGTAHNLKEDAQTLKQTTKNAINTDENS